MDRAAAGGGEVNRKFTALGAAFAFAFAACTSANPGASTAPGASPAPAGSAPAASSGGGAAVSLTIESWRNDDLSIWQDKIIPAFEANHPNIKLTFAPTAPADYNGVLNTKLEAGNAGDLITCRPFDASLALFKAGYLTSINDLSNLKNFGDVAKSAWITDDGKDVFCMPMASVIHGFIYNTEAFDKLGVTTSPTTVAEFHALLDKIKADGSYTPLVMGTKDLWESATMGFQNIGPDYWKGEEGRKALIAGSAKFTDQPYVDTWKELASWKPYMPDGFEAIAYPDAQAYFESGKGAIYPAGSWDIAYFEGKGVKIGFFGPPLPKAGDTCYISDHTDIALGMNAKSAHSAEAREFLDWVGSDEFATLYSNALPGFYSLSNNPVKIDDAVAQQAVDLRKSCKSTIRNSYQILSRGEPNLENELWRVTAAVVNGTLKPEKAAEAIQAGLDKWYKPKN
jgi:raffinose/stachyose/melibiose transport system substrate-binding protein